MLTDRSLLLIMAACAGVAFIAGCIALWAISIAVSQLERVEAEAVKRRLSQIETDVATINPAAISTRLSRVEETLMEAATDDRIRRIRDQMGALVERLAAAEGQVRELPANPLPGAADGGQDGASGVDERVRTIQSDIESVETLAAELANDVHLAYERMGKIEVEIRNIASEARVDELTAVTAAMRNELDKLQINFHSAAIDLASAQATLHADMESITLRSNNFGRIIRKLRLGSQRKGIHIVNGTYGANCEDTDEGNASAYLGAACNDKSECTYVIDRRIIGDPAPDCDKNFVAEWQCGKDERVRAATVEAEAGDRESLTLTCP